MIRVLFVCALLLPAVASAQAHRGSIEMGGGAVWTNGYDAGSAGANETRNPSQGSSPFTLFQSSSRVGGIAGIGARIGVYVTPRLLVAGLFEFSRPVLRTHVSADFEGATDTDAETTVSSYLLGGSLEYQFAWGRFVPFVSGGAGQLREVPEGGDVLSGTEVHAGAGVRYALTHGRHPFGVRGEIAASSRSRSVAFEDKRRVVPTASAGLTWRF